MDQVSIAKAEFRIQQWSNIIRACQSSGQTVVSWCADNGINVKTYYYWLRKLRLKSLPEQTLPAEKKMETPVPFARLEVQSPVNTQAAVVIRLPHATLEVQNGACQQTVEAVLLALKALC